MNKHFRVFQVFVFIAFLCQCQWAGAQQPLNFAGSHVLTNQTGTAHWAYFSVTLPGGYQGFVLTAENLSGSDALDLFVQSGSANPTEASYLKRSAPGSRILEMTAVELVAGEYRIGMLFQGATSGTTAQNRLRLIPILSAVGGTLTNQVINGRDLYFRIVATNSYPGFRAVLSKTNHNGIELTALRGDRPETGALLRSALGTFPETVWLTDVETTPGNYLLKIAGVATGTNTVTLRWETGFATTLTWDPGTVDGGTQLITNQPADPGGWRFFRVNAQDTVVGAWRTVLRVPSGSAEFYMQVGPPTGSPASGNPGIRSGITSNSARMFYTGQYSPGQDWYISVNTSPGSQWRLFTGEAFVHDLGNLLPADADPANLTINPAATTNIGPEGVRFFRTTVGSDTPAWRLWLNNGAATPATLSSFVEVRQTRVPIPTNSYDLRQSGQMLVVPPYLNQANAFFMAVSGNEGATINLDSRLQRVEDLAYGTPVTNAPITGFRYRTFRVQVPQDAIGWQVNARTLTGDVDLSLRRGDIGNETIYLAFSGANGAVSDSLTLVPPTLSDGSYFVTIYGKAQSTFTLQHGAPVVTDIPFVNSPISIPGYSCPTCTNGPIIINDDTNRNGWRYYRVGDLTSQLGVLGWLLQLTNQAPGTQIALRLSALPGGTPGEFSSTAGFLERQGHQAGVWYVGIYSPVAPLGAFELETRPFLPSSVNLDTTNTVGVVNQRGGSWEYFELNVPDTITDSNLLGMELQLKNVTGNGLRLQIRRDQVPYDTGLGTSAASPTWPSGSYLSGGGDWTFRARPGNNSDYVFLPMGWPLQPGHYYVGVRNDSGQPRGYTLNIETIGPAGSDKSYTIQSMSAAPGSGESVTNLNPREFRIYRLTVTNGTTNLRLQLNVTQGEARLFVRRNLLAGLPGPVAELTSLGTGLISMIQQAGSEIVTILPDHLQTNIAAGDYYVLVVAEGTVGSYNSGIIGTGPTSFELSVLPPIVPVDLGSFGPGQELVVNADFTPPERRLYTLEIQPGVKALDVRMDTLAGAPYLQWATHSGIVAVGSGIFGGSTYGWIGGWGDYTRVTSPFQLIPPAPGRYSFVIESRTTAPVLHSARLTLTTQESLPLAAEGDANITNQPPNSWRFLRVDIPATAGGATPAAWDLKLVNVTNESVYLAVAREKFPSGVFSDGPYLSILNSWPTNAQYLADEYFTLRNHGVAHYFKQMHVGWGWPVGPGTYYVGVNNASAEPQSYQVRSRLVGSSSSSLPVKVEELTWAGAGVLATVSNLPAGEARYFHLLIPPGTPMFRLKLAQLRGEARMTFRRGSVPGTHLYPGTYDPERQIVSSSFAREGDEYVSMLPLAGTNSIPPGDYYITVISEGQTIPGSGQLGTNVSDFRLEWLPDVQAVNLGTLVANGTFAWTNSSVWPDRTYAYLTIPVGARSLQIIHQSLTNPALLLLRPGTNLLSATGPSAANQLPGNLGTWFGGEAATFNMGNGSYTWNDPPPGTYTLFVDPANAASAAAITSFTLSSETPLNFTNSEIAYVQSGVSWRYFRVDVPTNAATVVRGWELRLADSPNNEGWSLTIRRDQLPPGGSPLSDTSTSWPSGACYNGQPFDWTGRGVPGMANSGYFASMAWGRPLQPGTYFVGVFNGSASPRSIRLVSRAIGDAGSGLPLQIEPLAFGETKAAADLPPGALKYYRLPLQAGITGAKFKLRMVQGDARWSVRRAMVPGISAGSISVVSPGDQLQTGIAGNEYMIWWPYSPQTTLTADDYYFVVAAEGSPTNPDNGSLGTGDTAYEISSATFAPTNLGTVIPHADLTNDAAYDRGEVLAYEFTVPPGTRALDVRLENRVGSPAFDIGVGSGLRWSVGGWFGGNAESPIDGGKRFIVLPEPATNRYWLTIGHRNSIGPLTAGSFRLRVRSLLAEMLSFSSLLNTNGVTNSVTNTLADGERRYYTVDIPESINGETPIGWYLKLTALQGSPLVRIRPGNILPDNGAPGVSGYFSAGLVVAPPYFRTGRWTIEVLASGDSQFVLTSERVQLERPAWAMPALGQPPTTTGVLPPLFADSSVDTNGVTLTNDVNLAQGRYHFYAVDVPEGNGGLLRAELLAISGNSDLYVRAGNIPTIEGGLYELTLNSGAITEFANWVPTDTRRQIQLTPGRWYFMVQANGSNVRYRLKLGVGQVTDLALSGGTATSQTLVANDWRYYRFSVPTNAPQFWDLTVSQQQGDVDIYLRDTAPPGVSAGANPATWASEVKNAGVSYQNFTTPGTWRFTTPQLRPGHIYYVGVRAAVDSQFSISSSTSGLLLTQAYPDLAFINPEGGSVSMTLAPFERKTWRVNVPADALRWRHVATNSSSVWLYLQNGSPPWALRGSPSDHYVSDGAPNAIFETALFDRIQGGWPWVRGETYFIAATNESAVPQPFSLRIDTRAWRLELAATNGTINASPNKPYYETGELVNLTPVPAAGYVFADWAADLSGTNQPGQIFMNTHRRVVALFDPIPYHINVTALNGTVQFSTNAPAYRYGTTVLLTATPNPGYKFDRWAGDIAAYDNPLLVEVTRDFNLTAVFQQNATKPLITAQPQGGTFRAGNPASLSVSALGTEPMVYQWLKNGSPVTSANSAILSFGTLSTNDAGLYSVVISNIAGTTVSLQAALNVQFVRNLDFNNNTPIVIRDATNAAPYPSIIGVSGVTSEISGVAITLGGLTHGWLEDVDILLVGPTTNILALSDAGSFPVSGLTLTLDDGAVEPVPSNGSLGNGSYQPTNYVGLAPASDNFLAPAPPPPYGSRLSDFAGTNVNGTWQLFVMDDYGKDDGIIVAGWTLSLLTLDTVFSPAPAPRELTAKTDAPSGTVGFGFSGMTGHTVQVQSSTDMITWQVVTEIFIATGAEEFTAPMSGNQRFYRCRILD